MGIVGIIIALSLAPHVVAAQSYDCVGSDPDWQLSMTPNAATFSFADRQSTMDIPQKSIAEGAEWPQAMTIVGPRDSAIVLLDQKHCGTGDIAAHVMTQRGQTPILLTGCCARRD